MPLTHFRMPVWGCHWRNDGDWAESATAVLLLPVWWWGCWRCWPLPPRSWPARTRKRAARSCGAGRRCCSPARSRACWETPKLAQYSYSTMQQSKGVFYNLTLLAPVPPLFWLRLSMIWNSSSILLYLASVRGVRFVSPPPPSSLSPPSGLPGAPPLFSFLFKAC